MVTLGGVRFIPLYPKIDFLTNFIYKKTRAKSVVLIRKLNPPKFSYSFRWVYNLYV